MTRVRATNNQRVRLLEANAFRCCVCKRRSIGFHLHHIDGNSANTVDSNLAVLCVEDHDRHHRPGEYAGRPRHSELDALEILNFKTGWETFIVAARHPEPTVLATLSCFGTENLIHSLQLVMQWPDERIAMSISYHLLDGNLDRLTDQVFEDIASIGPNIKMAVINEPLPVEHCMCCGTGLSRTVKPAVMTRLTDPMWATESLCCIYINPDQPSLAIVFFLRDQGIISGHLHLCQDQYLHYHTDGIDDHMPVDRRPGVRTQVTRIVNTVLAEWHPAQVLVGTGDPDNPRPLSGLILPTCWETRRSNGKSKVFSKNPTGKANNPSRFGHIEGARRKKKRKSPEGAPPKASR